MTAGFVQESGKASVVWVVGLYVRDTLLHQYMSPRYKSTAGSNARVVRVFSTENFYLIQSQGFLQQHLLFIS